MNPIYIRCLSLRFNRSSILPYRLIVGKFNRLVYGKYSEIQNLANMLRGIEV